jgi:hypothetical protein
MTATEAAKVLGISHQAVLKRASNRGVGSKAGGSRELRFWPAAVVSCAFWLAECAATVLRPRCGENALLRIAM